MVFKGFVGSAYREASVIAAADTAVNLLLEYSASQKKFVFFGRPGLSEFETRFGGQFPVGGLFAGDHRLFAVVGSKLYEVFDAGALLPQLRGDVGSFNGQAQIIANGNQLFVVNAGNPYIDLGTGLFQIQESLGSGVVNTAGTAVTWVSGDTFEGLTNGDTITIGGTDYTIPAQVYTVAVTPVTPFTSLTLTSSAGVQAGVPYAAFRTFGSSSGTYLDGYFIIAVPNSKDWRWSALNDGKTWDPADTEAKEGYPDAICRVLAHDRRLWIFGFQTTEIWENSGNPPPASPFSRVAYIPQGCSAPYSPAEVGPTSIMWLSASDQGGNVVLRADSVQPQRISTHALEYAMGTYSTVQDAEGYGDLFRGHYLYVLTFPSGVEQEDAGGGAPGMTWIYDLTASSQLGEPVWTRYAAFMNGAYARYRGRVHAFVQGWNGGKGRQILGDWETGTLWEESPTYLTDGGGVIKRERTAPLLLQEDQRITVWRAELLMQNGVIAAGDATMMLEISYDGGEVYGNIHEADAGSIGEYKQRVLWRQLGTGRRIVIRITDTNEMEACYTDMFLRLSVEADKVA